MNLRDEIAKDGLGSVDADAIVRAHDRDGERYRFITEDHADSSVRAKIRELLNRLPVMSYAAASAAIDAASGGER